MSAFDGLLPIVPGPSATEDPSAGEGPFTRLILRDVTIVDGTGGPPYGPADIVVNGSRIEAIVTRHNATQMVQTLEAAVPRPGDRVLDLKGTYVLPGFVDAHAHIVSSAQVKTAEYLYKLWLAHGVTTVRELGAMTNGIDFTFSETRRSNSSEIAAPFIVNYLLFGEGRGGPITTERDARSWVQQARERGAKGIKFFGTPPDALRGALDEARQVGLGTACHHAQTDVARGNALDTARWGLGSVEHWYGLPESLFVDRTVQKYPIGYNYLNERDRFSAAGELWQQAAPPGSSRWNDAIDEFIGLGTSLVPTFNGYIATRDVARVRNAGWFENYVTPTLMRFFEPNPEAHGSFFSDWGTEQEASWRRTYQLWMSFVKDFHDRGGNLCAGSDSGFLYKVFGFGFIEELELLREAGLSSLEVIRAATLQSAKLLGIDGETGSVEPGKRADLVLVGSNPLANLKALYGRPWERGFGGDSPSPGGITATIKAGVIFDARALLERVREIVETERADALVLVG